MEGKLEEFINDGFHIRIQDGICYVTFLKEYYSESEIDFIIIKRIELFNGKTYPMLADISKTFGGYPEAERRVSFYDGCIGVSALAVFFQNELQLSQFLKHQSKYKTQLPFKIFTNIEQAKEWLVKYIITVSNNGKVVLFENDAFSMKVIDNILYLKWLKEYYNYEEIDFMIQKKAELLQDKLFLAVSDIRKVKGGSRQARIRIKRSDGNIGVLAMAVLCTTRVQKSFFDFYLFSIKQSIPIKSFTTEKKAIDWLLKSDTEIQKTTYGFIY
jgi:hypothetical protein